MAELYGGFLPQQFLHIQTSQLTYPLSKGKIILETELHPVILNSRAGNLFKLVKYI